MIVDRYPPADLLSLLPQSMQRIDPVLATLDRLLDDDVLFGQIKADLAQRAPQSRERGRPSTPVEVVLRMLVVRRLYDWSYEETERLVWDSLSLRQFCRIYDHAVPDDTTLLRWAGLIRPETVHALNARVVRLAWQAKVTRGRRLRSDGTVVETRIHHPTDSALLADAGRVLGRVVRRARVVVGQDAPARLFRDWSRSTKRLARRIGEAARKRGEQGEQARKASYRRLLGIMTTVQRQCREVRALLGTAGEAGERLAAQLDHTLPLVEQVVSQTRRRLAGEKVPAPEKIVSLFEEHTAILKRDKPGRQTEYGHKVWLDGVEGGIISDYRILEGNPPEAPQLPESVRRHRDQFGRAPHLVTADRGLHAPDQEETIQAMGVRRVAVPVQGKPPPERRRYERQRWFRAAQRYRAGIEGRISVAKRRGWLARCRDHGRQGFDRWVGWGVITANLTAIARHQATRPARRAA
jgi:IS5 family transposase